MKAKLCDMNFLKIFMYKIRISILFEKIQKKETLDPFLITVLKRVPEKQYYHKNKINLICLYVFFSYFLNM